MGCCSRLSPHSCMYIQWCRIWWLVGTAAPEVECCMTRWCSFCSQWMAERQTDCRKRSSRRSLGISCPSPSYRYTCWCRIGSLVGTLAPGRVLRGLRLCISYIRSLALHGMCFRWLCTHSWSDLQNRNTKITDIIMSNHQEVDNK